MNELNDYFAISEIHFKATNNNAEVGFNKKSINSSKCIR